MAISYISDLQDFDFCYCKIVNLISIVLLGWLKKSSAWIIKNNITYNYYNNQKVMAVYKNYNLKKIDWIDLTMTKLSVN